MSRLTLLQFLRQSYHIHTQHLAGALPPSSVPVYVVGNPSADLDSIVSAIIYSYFASGHLPSSQPRPHIPLINLPNVPSGPELCRLRPEFVAALCFSTNNTNTCADTDNNPQSAGNLLREHVLTVADLQSQLKREQPKEWALDATLVDWNALPMRRQQQRGRGSLDGLHNVHVHVIGCIDHHVDEDFLPTHESLPTGQPCRVESGPGSCASLVVEELRARGLWSDGASSPSDDDDDSARIAQVQAAQLALSAILIDTTNLTAKGRVMDVDRRSVAFLEATIRQGLDAPPSWDRTRLFETVHQAKLNSLDLLTVHEILDRDYKEWTETATNNNDNETVKIGFCSVVKPIPWIVAKAGSSPETFLDELRRFAVGKHLDVVVVMTAWNSNNTDNTDKNNSSGGRFHRELFVAVVDDHHREVSIRCCDRFARLAVEELRLEEWTADELHVDRQTADGIRSLLNGSDAHGFLWRRVWNQLDVSKSRKQVAPLMRRAVAE